MYDINLLRTWMHSENHGVLLTITYGGERLYTSPLYADAASARGALVDIKDAISDARCIWCNRPADRVSDFGNLDDDARDFAAFCNDDACVADAREEARHG